MTLTRRLLAAGVLTASLLFNHVAFSADNSICRESIDKQIQSLNLNADQKTKIQPILDNMKSQMKTAGTQMGSLEDQLNGLTYSPNLDQSKVNSVVDQKAKLIGDMMKAKVTATNQVYNILNDQQKAKLQDAMKKQDERMAALYKGCYED